MTDADAAKRLRALLASVDEAEAPDPHEPALTLADVAGEGLDEALKVAITKLEGGR